MDKRLLLSTCLTIGASWEFLQPMSHQAMTEVTIPPERRNIVKSFT